MIDKYCLYIYSLHSVQRDIYIHTIEGRLGFEHNCHLENISKNSDVRTDCAPLKKVGV